MKRLLLAVALIGCGKTEAENVIDQAAEARAESDRLKQQVDAELRARDQAAHDAALAGEQLERLEKELDAVNEKVSTAVFAVADARTDAARAAARAHLAKLQDEQTHLKDQIAPLLPPSASH